MRHSREEMFLVEQSLKNLGFMIQLQLGLVSTLADRCPEAGRAAADLRRMMELEEALRARQRSAGPPCQTQAAA